MKNINLIRSSYPESPAEVGGTLFFQADDGRVGEELWAVTPCGDGTLNPCEECDDGNLERGDGCSERRRVEDVPTTSSTTTTETVPSTTSTSTSSSTTSTTGAAVTSTSHAATTTAPSLTTTPASTPTTSTLPRACDPAVPSTCDLDQCESPRLRRRAGRLAASIQHALGAGRTPRGRMVRRLTKVLVRCGVLPGATP